MDTITQAQLYLADQRGCSQTDFFRSFHLFNFGTYVAEGRQPMGRLRVLNDTSLAAGHSVTMSVDEPTDVVILPLVGGLAYKSQLNNGFLEVGQVQLFPLTDGMTYAISNPYETELINYLEIWLANPGSNANPNQRVTHVDLSVGNTLVPVFSQPDCRGFMGRYAGRAEGVYGLSNAGNGIFVYVLSGIFEVQNRLLHERDGLALTAVRAGEVEFEALSNDAVLLLLEIPSHTEG